jgi:NitT/TauT family transport system substrate-binding protein
VNIVKKRSRIATAVVVAGTLALSLAACGGSTGSSSPAPASAALIPLTVSYSEVVADELPLWLALDSGLFKKQGLDVTLTSLSSSNGVPALISGQTQLASIGGSEMVSGAASGAKMVYLATLTPVFPYKLYTKAADAAALKGKRFGITSSSGALYIATLAALKQLGLSPSDVTLIPLGSVANVNNALLAGSIDAAVSHPPTSVKIEAAGFHSLLDLATQKIPTSNVGIAAMKSYVSANKETVKKFMTALQEAIAREKSDQAYSVSELSTHLKVTDQKALQETWQYYAKEVLPNVPTPTVVQLQIAQQALAAKNPAVTKLDLSTLVDASFLTPAK